MGPFRDQTNVLRSILIWVYGLTCQLLAELRCIEEATLSDVLGKFVLPFMLVHVYMCTDPKLTRAHVAYSWHRWLGHARG